MKINIKYPNSAVTVAVGQPAAKVLGDYFKNQAYDSIFIIYDKKLKVSAQKIAQQLKAKGQSCTLLGLNAGESVKTIKSLVAIYRWLVKNRANRHSLLVALGGGTIGDVVGFTSATYMRGIAWVNIPTTLLAQVDSALGGKTAVNLGQIKNCIGAFYQPQLVICDLKFLATLNRRSMVSGLGEIIKYGLIADANFFNYLTTHYQAVLDQDQKVLKYVVVQSLKHKNNVVSADPLERRGQREHLNFGHTFGHGLESITHYKKLEHGEAVLWGMRMAVELSNKLNLLAAADYKRVSSFLAKIALPPLSPNLANQKLIHWFKKDKKNQRDYSNFILLTAIGQTQKIRLKNTAANSNILIQIVKKVISA